MNPPPPPPYAANFHPSHNPNPPPPPSLTGGLSDLTSLLHLCRTTLNSLPTPTPTAHTLLPCPFNPNHLIPPSSLFSHYLNCPSPLPLHSSDFFYRNCPGPVTPLVHPPPSLNLPRTLHMECAEFDKDLGGSVNFIRFLPSEVWAIRSEIEAWGGGCPTVYSSRILRAILRLRDCNSFHLHEWIVANSPKYGIVIDFAMGDHVVLLARLCLKAIVREAFVLAGFTFCDGESKLEENGNLLLRLSNKSYECPSLVEVVMWLALQFSILYGEVNGKFLAVDVLKECILDSASHASLFPLEEKDAESNEFEKVDKDVGDNKKDERGNINDQPVCDSVISVSQVEAAVAALHERSMIEEKIKELRNPRPLSAYQRNMEHAYVSKIAEEVRQKRSDYRPIIEHDGLLWQRSNNQDTGKLKTREELLAEERDYKRRRMSYRGKKLKRNTIEVTRSIIDEYMEEIKQAGGISGMSKAVEDTKPLESASPTGVSGTRMNIEVSEENKGRTDDYKKETNSHWDNGLQNSNRNAKWARPDRNDHSRSRDVRQSSSRSRDVEPFGEDSSNRLRKSRSKSHERNYHKRNKDELERNNHKRDRDEHERTSRKRERYEDKRGHDDRGRSNTNSTRRERDEDDDRDRDRRRRKADEFDDRYEPSDSHDF